MEWEELDIKRTKKRGKKKEGMKGDSRLSARALLWTRGETEEREGWAFFDRLSIVWRLTKGGILTCRWDESRNLWAVSQGDESESCTAQSQREAK